MSLLMDALKKAEQEKKEAAKRLKQTGPNPIVDTGEHRIQGAGNLENTGPNEMTVSQEMDLSLEPLESGQAVSPPDYTDEHPVAGDNTAEMEHPPDNTAEQEVSGEMPIQENTQEMGVELPPVMDRDAMALTIDNTLDEVVDEEDFTSPFADEEYAFDETLDSVTASQLAADIGSVPEQPTPVAAHTVFEASRGSNWAQNSRWALFSVGVIAVLVAGGVVVHYQTTPATPNIPKPVALPAEIQAQQAALAALPKPSLQPDPMTAQEVSGEISESLVAETPPVEESIAGPEAGEDADTAATQVDEPAAAELPPLDELVGSGAPENIEEQPGTMPDSVPEPVVAMQEEPAITDVMEEETFEPIPPARPVTPEMIRISRSKSRDVATGNNQSAYRAYQSGNLAQAEALYKTTLAKSTDNRDALLGLAAIKLRQADKAAAFLIYRKLLHLNPKDKVARLALINLQQRGNPVNDESRLKLMLAEQPESPHLYFSLGTLYAAQLKWADAQRAFFEAFSRDSTNPDYALNLAVSLDHMGQQRAASDYYQRAVELADSNPASFTVSDVLERIRAIGQAQRS